MIFFAIFPALIGKQKIRQIFVITCLLIASTNVVIGKITPDSVYNNRKHVMDMVFSNPMAIVTDIDVLKQMPNNRPDSILFDTYKIVATFYGVTNQNDSAIVYFKKAIRYAPPNSPEYIKVSRNLSTVYRRMGNFADALVGLNQTLAVAKKINHEYSEASVYMELAACYNFLHDITRTIENLLQAIVLFEKLGKNAESDLAICRLNLGIVYLNNNDLEKAEKTLLSAMIELKRLNSPVNFEIAKLSYAHVLSKKELFAEAEPLLKSAMAGLEPFNEYESMADCRLELSRIYVKQGRIKEALQILKENHETAITVGSIDPIKHTLYYINLLNQEKQFEKSYDIGLKQLKYADQTTRDNAIKFFTSTAVAAFNIGKIKEASEILEKINPAVDSLITYQSDAVFNQMQMFYNDKIKAQEIELLEKEKQQLYKQKQTTALVIVLLLAGFAGFLVHYYNKNRLQQKLKEVLTLQLHADEVLQQKLTIENEKERLNSALKDEILNRQKLAIEDKNTFIRNLSNELRTPLNGIVGTTNMLLLDKSLTDEQHQIVKKLQFCADQLNALVSAILDFESLESGNMAFEKTAFTLKQIIAENKERFAELAAQKGIVYEINCNCGENKTYYSDALKIKSIISNLALNAINFTNQGKVVLHVYAVKEGDYKDTLRFEVEDTGIGINPEKQELIFKAFEQVDSSNTKKIGVLGLGLSISQAMAIGLNSKILFESVPGKGSRFWFDLDLTFTLRNTSFSTTNNNLTASSHKNTRALVVEDSAVNAFILIKMLENKNIIADIAENGKEAYNKLKAGLVYDVVLTDLQMPEMDGITFIKKVRSSNAIFSNIPIIAITASTDAQFKTDSIQAGANAFFTKPFTEQNITNALAYVLKK